MSGVTEVKPGMYAEELSEEERKEEYTLSKEDKEEIRKHVSGTDSDE